VTGKRYTSASIELTGPLGPIEPIEMIRGGITHIERAYNYHDEHLQLVHVPLRLHVVHRDVSLWEFANANLVEGVDWIRGEHVDDAEGKALLAAHMLARSA